MPKYGMIRMPGFDRRRHREYRSWFNDKVVVRWGGGSDEDDIDEVNSSMDYTTNVQHDIAEDQSDPVFYAHHHDGDEINTVATLELEDGAEFYVILNGRVELEVRHPDTWSTDQLTHDEITPDKLAEYGIENDEQLEQMEHDSNLSWRKSNRFECGVQHADAESTNWNSSPKYNVREAIVGMIRRANSYIEDEYSDMHTLDLTVDDILDTDEGSDQLEDADAEVLQRALTIVDKHAKQVFEVNAEDGQVKCGSCNYMTTDLYIVADTESTVDRMEQTGRCGTCTMEHLLGQDVEVLV